MICRGERQPHPGRDLAHLRVLLDEKAQDAEDQGREELEAAVGQGHDKAAVGELRASGQVTGVGDHDRERLWRRSTCL